MAGVSLPLAGFAAALLLWGLLAMRRAAFDGLLLALAGALLLLRAFQPLLRERFGAQFDIGILPELVLAATGLLLLIRLFFSGLSLPERLGMGALGCLLLLPALVILGFISLWIFGSGPPRGPAAQPAASDNQAAPAPAREQPR